jgi:phage baseplate assembly protein W
VSKYYAGIGLPWGIEIPSVIDPKDDYDVIRSSILWIILCSFGERVCLPTYGSLLPRLVFEPNDIITVNQVKESVRDAILKWDDRVQFVDFQVETIDNEIRCKVLYKFNVDKQHNEVQVLEFNLTEEMVVK